MACRGMRHQAFSSAASSWRTFASLPASRARTDHRIEICRAVRQRKREPGLRSWRWYRRRSVTGAVAATSAAVLPRIPASQWRPADDHSGCSAAATACSQALRSRRSAPRRPPLRRRPVSIPATQFQLDNGLGDLPPRPLRPVVAVVLAARGLGARAARAHRLRAPVRAPVLPRLGEPRSGGLDGSAPASAAPAPTARQFRPHQLPADGAQRRWKDAVGRADKLGFFINTVTDAVLAKEIQVVKNGSAGRGQPPLRPARCAPGEHLSRDIHTAGR